MGGDPNTIQLLSLQKGPQTRLLRQQKWTASQSGGQKSKVQMLAGLVPLEAVREGLVHGSLLAAGGVLATSGTPWLLEAPP